MNITDIQLQELLQTSAVLVTVVNDPEKQEQYWKEKESVCAMIPLVIFYI